MYGRERSEHCWGICKKKQKPWSWQLKKILQHCTIKMISWVTKKHLSERSWLWGADPNRSRGKEARASSDGGWNYFEGGFRQRYCRPIECRRSKAGAGHERESSLSIGSRPYNSCPRGSISMFCWVQSLFQLASQWPNLKKPKPLPLRVDGIFEFSSLFPYIINRQKTPKITFPHFRPTPIRAQHRILKEPTSADNTPPPGGGMAIPRQLYEHGLDVGNGVVGPYIASDCLPSQILDEYLNDSLQHKKARKLIEETLSNFLQF